MTPKPEMPKRDKYDEATTGVMRLCEQHEPYSFVFEDVRDFLRSAFPPPAEDARRLVDYLLDTRGITLTVGSQSSATFDAHFRNDWATMIESFAQSRVEPWRELLNWVTHLICGQGKRGGVPESGEIEEATAQARALLSDSPAKEATP